MFEDHVAAELHVCPYCDVEMKLTRTRQQWTCPLCFIPEPRVSKKPVKVSSAHGQELK